MSRSWLFLQHAKTAVDKVSIDFFNALHEGEHDESVELCYRAQQDLKSVNVPFGSWLDKAEGFANAKQGDRCDASDHGLLSLPGIDKKGASVP